MSTTIGGGTPGIQAGMWVGIPGTALLGVGDGDGVLGIQAGIGAGTTPYGTARIIIAHTTDGTDIIIITPTIAEAAAMLTTAA